MEDTGEALEDLKRANAVSRFKNGMNNDPGTYRHQLIFLTWKNQNKSSKNQFARTEESA